MSSIDPAPAFPFIDLVKEELERRFDNTKPQLGAHPRVHRSNG